jgi:hypothetical protein
MLDKEVSARWTTKPMELKKTSLTKLELKY